MKLSHRLSAVIGAVCLLFVATALISLWGLHNSRARIDRFVERDQAELLAVNRLYGLAQASSLSLRSFYIDPTDDKALASLNAASAAIDSAAATLGTLVSNDEGDKKRLTKFLALRKLQQQYQTEARDLITAGSLDDARDHISQFENFLAWAPMQVLLNGWIKDTEAQVARAHDESTAATQRIEAVVIAVSVVAVVLAALLGSWLVRSVMRQIGGEPDAARAIMRDLAAGDLSHAVVLKHGDRDSVLASVEAVRLSLAGNVKTLRALAEQLNGEAVGASAGAGRISDSARGQSDAAAAMAAAIEQLSVGVNHLADNAGTAYGLSERAGKAAETGGENIRRVGDDIDRVAGSIRQAAVTINTLSEETGRISGIVAVIREIADQTNLLALNAAIEAARAGEQGRGFAVVADEVRKLAERTSQATAEIGKLISDTQSSTVIAVRDMEATVDQVEDSVSGARVAEASMGDIRTGNRELVSVVNDISLALREQSSASQDIARNVERIVHMVGATSTAAEEGTAAARRLEGVAQELRTSVAHFRL
ncbi:methyl-accepting chemotaxis protein [Andreprevotia chitinilytica]|uniref:methyl-accepting chemotaxis protein n=1 Tax=Andreprevotia chitinilytica TaxID=396808 RepID=UPI0006918823|nr:methyl-accepting chemotaxis protein [Andreprevotia chitinilytica]